MNVHGGNPGNVAILASGFTILPVRPTNQMSENYASILTYRISNCRGAIGVTRVCATAFSVDGVQYYQSNSFFDQGCIDTYWGLDLKFVGDVEFGKMFVHAPSTKKVFLFVVDGGTFYDTYETMFN